MRHPLAPVLLAPLLALVTACSGGTSSSAPAPVAAPSTTSVVDPTASPLPSPTPSGAPSATTRPTPSRTASPKPAATARRTPSPSAAPRVVAAADGVRRVFPIRGCKVSYGHSHHDYPATDMFAARGCAVVAPVAGRVDEVTTVDRWSSSTNKGADRGGLSWSIVGVDGVRYYGSHLRSIAVRAGQRVSAGQVLGEVGDTGSARGTSPHLHFGLSWPTRAGVWWVRRGEVYPWPYLDSWRAGGWKSPAAAVAAAHRRQGDVPPCPSYC